MNELKQEFELAITKHVLFKSKVRSYLYGSDIDLEPILDLTKCQFGKWLTENGLPRFGNMPEMQQLDQVHRDIHKHAIALVHLKQNGKTEEALTGVDKLNIIADELITLLRIIQAKAGQTPNR